MSAVNAMAFPKRNIFSALFFLCLLTACAKPLPDMGQVPDFSLQDQSGETVVKKDLAGSVWVANFIYTGCGSACPLLTQRLSEASKGFLDSEGRFPVRLVSFTVDPETDTPQRLNEYAGRFGASRENWLFLTGPTEQIRKTVSDGFKLAYQKTGEVDVFHSEKLVVIDAVGRIRGYFDSDPRGLGALRQAVERLRDPAQKSGGG